MGRSSYGGILGRHRWTGRYEAHLWDNSCRREGQSRKGRQGTCAALANLRCFSQYTVFFPLFYGSFFGLTCAPCFNYHDLLMWRIMVGCSVSRYVLSLNIISYYSLFIINLWEIIWLIEKLSGGYDKEEKAARAYDLAALKYWGPTTTTNFPVSNPSYSFYIFLLMGHRWNLQNYSSTHKNTHVFAQVSNYEKELEEMKNMTRQEFVASLRRLGQGKLTGLQSHACTLILYLHAAYVHTHILRFVYFWYRKSSGFSRGASIYRGVTRYNLNKF